MADGRQGVPWRQGFVLTADHAKALGVVHPRAGDDPISVVITHDCDLENEKELDCEIIPGRHIAELGGDFTNAKNPRQLHLSFSGGEIVAHAEFLASDKRQISKAKLFAQEPANGVKLKPLELDRLKTWLGIRYDRSAFANEFDRRFKDKKLKLYEKFVRAIQKTGSHLQSVLISVDNGDEVTRDGPDDTYSLDIVLLYSVDEDPAAAEISAIAAAEEITAAFKKTCQQENGQWKHIELRDCRPVSEGELSVYDQRCLQEWHFEYLSLREDE